MQSIEVQRAELVPLNKAIRDFIPGDKNPSTAWRWVTRGLQGIDGQRIRLQVWYVGRQPHTTNAAIDAWLDAVTEARLARMQRTQQLASDPSHDELEAVGLR